MKKVNQASKQVRETKAAKAISAHVILKNGKHFATIQAHYSDSGVVTVDLWAEYWEDVKNAFPETPEDQIYCRVHVGKAGGYGYDKFGAAMSHGNADQFFNYHKPHKEAKDVNFIYNGETLNYIRSLGYVVITAI